MRHSIEYSDWVTVLRSFRSTVRNRKNIRGGERIVLDFRGNGERLPGILLLPATGGPCAASLLLHGYGLDKERMADTVGLELLARGIASLALDLPLHGERFEAIDPYSFRVPFALLRRWRGAVRESILALRFLARRPDVDSRRLSVVGYSLGSFLGLKVAARHRSLRAIVLAAGGDLPDYTPFAPLVRRLMDPLKLAWRVRGRPVLMVHGREDRVILPSQAERLYRALGQPKEIRWWDSGHILPPPAIADAADWLAGQLRAAPDSALRDTPRFSWPDGGFNSLIRGHKEHSIHE